MNFVTYENLTDTIFKNLSKIPKDIDLVVGIPRSGLLVANIIALYLNLPFSDLKTFLNQDFFKTGNTRKVKNWVTSFRDIKKVLIVEDSISTGESIKSTKKQIYNSNFSNINFIYLAVYALPTNFHKVDIFFSIVNHPRMFEWNFLHHWGLSYACVDIDGVICDDPTVFQNDAGSKYIEFIRNAKPKFIPTQTIGFLVTCRLEKYRKETEEWLNKNNIPYNNLIMLEKKDSIDFRHGFFKGNIYKNTNCFIFIESSYEQAIDICKISGKQVFCIENRRLITPDNISSHLKIIANDFKITAKRVIKKILSKLQK